MSQRESGYERLALDQYETPTWVTAALVPHLPAGISLVWEPASGSGKMVEALKSGGLKVEHSDISSGQDFLQSRRAGFDAIITNPPYVLAQKFIEHALALMEARGGLVAMLLRSDFDHAKTRVHLFHGCRAFAKKVVLTKRIVWFDDKKAAPSFNHAWFIWDWRHAGPPTISYDLQEARCDDGRPRRGTP